MKVTYFQEINMFTDLQPLVVIKFLHPLSWGWGSSVSIVTRQDNGPCWVRFSAQVKDVSFFGQMIQTHSGVHLRSRTMHSGVKGLEHEADRSSVPRFRMLGPTFLFYSPNNPEWLWGRDFFRFCV